MKIRFHKDTNIRSDPHSPHSAALGLVYANTVLEVDDLIHEGASLKGDNRWWRDHNGWYYWAGATEPVTGEDDKETTTAPDDRPLPPVAATELIVLPVPDDSLAPKGVIPEGDWRSLDEQKS